VGSVTPRPPRAKSRRPAALKLELRPRRSTNCLGEESLVACSSGNDGECRPPTPRRGRWEARRDAGSDAARAPWPRRGFGWARCGLARRCGDAAAGPQLLASGAPPAACADLEAGGRGGLAHVALRRRQAPGPRAASTHWLIAGAGRRDGRCSLLARRAASASLAAPLEAPIAPLGSSPGSSWAPSLRRRRRPAARSRRPPLPLLRRTRPSSWRS
jgi:hypothetical protein